MGSLYYWIERGVLSERRYRANFGRVSDSLKLVRHCIICNFTPMLFSFQNFETQNEKANITSNLRATMDHLTRQIRKADTVEVVDNSTINVDSMIYTIDGRNLTKDGNVVIEGIDKLFINENGEGMNNTSS